VDNKEHFLEKIKKIIPNLIFIIIFTCIFYTYWNVENTGWKTDNTNDMFYDIKK
jgi:hypothetical protein